MSPKLKAEIARLQAERQDKMWQIEEELRREKERAARRMARRFLYGFGRDYRAKIDAARKAGDA